MKSEKASRELGLLESGAHWLGLELTEEQLSQFAAYAAELKAWNKKINLTAITDPEGIQTKHFLDSLTCFLGFPRIEERQLSRPLSTLPPLTDVQVADIGAGAGFPGIPLAIARPAISLTLIEAVGKKTVFLEQILRALGLNRAKVLAGRAEDVARMPDQRERYDVAVARAVADLSVLAEYCLPFVRTGGRFIAMKKAEVQPELDAARDAIAALGGSLCGVRYVEIPQLLDRRALVLIDKISPTSRDFPRRAGMPAKRPIGKRAGPRLSNREFTSRESNQLGTGIRSLDCGHLRLQQKSRGGQEHCRR